jgi:hypothetical protein
MVMMKLTVVVMRSTMEVAALLMLLVIRCNCNHDGDCDLHDSHNSKSLFDRTLFVFAKFL